jgi:hypothetical protein
MRRWVLVAGVAAALAIVAAAEGAVPATRRYPVSPAQAFALADRALARIGAEVVDRAPDAGTLVGRIAAPGGGAPLLLDVEIARAGPESWVHVSGRSGEAEAPAAELDRWRRRFFRRLDALAEGQVEAKLVPERDPFASPARPGQFNDAWLENPPYAEWILNPMELH